ncbi:hypothetical protein E4U13_008101 [Claviceps humidiphila]|uniref:Uncharacterized protein n=1 Tax=Claviceps humidiphila TaxID=1294629 RepID=A0A9P7PV35_9HYPO|nr:hypothetical protein E4U13_008101 [Claviceps humidiphila]
MSVRQSRSRVSSRSSTVPQIEIQAPRTSTSKRVPRDTGFPEPFHKVSNTTLPHPDADLSPNATLSSDDVSPERVLKRNRLSFLKKNNKRTVSHGTLDPHSEALHSIVCLSTMAVAGAEKKHSRSDADSSTPSIWLAKDGDSSVHSGSKKGEDETPPTSPDMSEKQRKPRVFYKWKRN